MKRDKNRPAIPENIKREVRQRCGFGCVLCGSPIYDYEHMEEWAIVKRHKANEITLLCPQHHAEKTRKLIPSYVIKIADKSPYNIRNGQSSPYNVFYVGDDVSVKIGNSHFFFNNNNDGAIMIPIMIDDIVICGIQLLQGHYLIFLTLYDDYNNIILQIAENNLVYSSGIWDIRFISNRLIINQEARKILLEIIFEVPNTIKIVKGIFKYNGHKLQITNSGLFYKNRNATLHNIRSNDEIIIGIGNMSFPSLIKL